MKLRFCIVVQASQLVTFNKHDVAWPRLRWQSWHAHYRDYSWAALSLALSITVNYNWPRVVYSKCYECKPFWLTYVSFFRYLYFPIMPVHFKVASHWHDAEPISFSGNDARLTKPEELLTRSRTTNCAELLQSSFSNKEVDFSLWIAHAMVLFHGL